MIKTIIFTILFIGNIALPSLLYSMESTCTDSVKLEKKRVYDIDLSEFEHLSVKGIDDIDSMPNYRYEIVRTNHYDETAIFVNSIYVHSWIGVNRRLIADIGREKNRKWVKSHSVQARDSLLIIEGKAFRSYRNYDCEEYQPEWVTLWDIQKKYTPGIRLKDCLFMFDEYILTTDLIRYKFDPDFLDSVVVIYPKQIQSMDKEKYLDLHIFHLYSKNVEVNMPTIFQANENKFIGEDFDTVNKNTLLSLQDVLDQNVPNNWGVDGAYLFMINQQFILSDLAEIRIDPDYIHTVKVYPPEVLQRLDEGFHEQVTIVRIYVKDPETIDRCTGKITWGELSIINSYDPMNFR